MLELLLSPATTKCEDGVCTVLNETNILENGFLNEFQIAQNNLTIARGGNINANTGITNFGNQGLPGQKAIPIIQTAIGSQLRIGRAAAT